MTIQDFIEKYGHGELYTSYGVKNKDGVFVPVIDVKTAVKAIEEIVKLKCAEQRQLCADESKINVEAKFKGEVRNTKSDSYFYDFKDMGGKRNITVNKDLIINAKEPKL